MANINVCPTCQGEFVRRGGESTTLVGYGGGCSLGGHDDNCKVRAYVCENGHVTRVSIRRTCKCGWVGKASCLMCGGDKVDEWPEEVPAPQNQKELMDFMAVFDNV